MSVDALTSKIFLIVGALILISSLYIFATTSSPIETKTPLEYTRQCEMITESKSYLGELQKCISGTWTSDQLRKDITAEANRPLYNGISMGGAGLGSLMFISGLAMQRRRSE